MLTTSLRCPPAHRRLWSVASALVAVLATAASCQDGSVNDLYLFPSTKQVQLQVSVELASGAGRAAIDPAASSPSLLRAFAADSSEISVPLARVGQAPVAQLPVSLTGPSLSFAAVAAVPAAMQPGPNGYALHFQLVPATPDNALVAADGSQLEALLGGVQSGTDPSANPVRLSLASTLAVQLLGAQGVFLGAGASGARLDAYAQIAAMLEARQTELEGNVDASAKVSLGGYARAIIAALQNAIGTDAALQAQLAAVALAATSTGAAGDSQATAAAGFAAAVTAWSTASSALFAAGAQGPAVVFKSPFVAAAQQAAAQATPIVALAPSALAFTDTDPSPTVGGTVTLRPAPAATGVASYAFYLGGADLAHSRLTKLGEAASSFTLAAGTALPDGASAIWAFPIVGNVELAGGTRVAIANRIDALGPPATLTARGGDGNVGLSWAAVAGATGYNIYRSSSLPVVPGSCLALPASGSPYVDAGLTNGAAYYYAVAALNGPVAGPVSIPALGVPAAPLDPPEGLGRSPGDAQVTVTWSPNPAATGYNLYRSQVQPPSRADATLLANVQSPFVDAGLTNNVTYHYALALMHHDTEGPLTGFLPAMPYAIDFPPAHFSMVAVAGSAVGFWEAVPRALSYTLYSGSSLPLTPSSANTHTQALTLNTGITSNVCYYALSATTADGEGPMSAPVMLDPRTVVLSNGKQAAYVVGQPAFAATDYVASAQVIRGPTTGIARSSYGSLLLTDGAANRVLGFKTMPTVNGATPDFVLGQADVGDIGVASGSAADQLSRPQGLYADDDRVWVVDRMVAVSGFPPGQADLPAQPGRVLGFSPQPTTNMAAASLVLGAPDFAWPQAAAGASARSYIGASHVTGGGGRLVVCDQAGNRVLIYKKTPEFSNTPADLVLGQTDFAGTAAHADAVTAATLNAPSSAWTDGVRLLVFDSGNNRVLLWHTFPTTSGQPADLVLGQPDKTHASINAGGAVSASGLANGQNPISSPGVSSNGSQIAVADPDNNRVLIWDNFPTTDGQPASRVLGQPDFQTANGSPPSITTLEGPQAVYIDGGVVVVGDTGNQRYMIWQSDPA